MQNSKMIDVIVPGATYKVPTYKIDDDGIIDGSGIENYSAKEINKTHLY